MDSVFFVRHQQLLSEIGFMSAGYFASTSMIPSHSLNWMNYSRLASVVASQSNIANEH